MKRSHALRLLTCLAAVLATAGPALAQAACERYKAELASLNRSGAAARDAVAAAQRQQAEISRLVGYYRSLGCEQGSFFFQPAAECGAIAQRIRSLQGAYAAVAGQAFDPAASENRRRQLRAAIAKACEPEGGEREAKPSPEPKPALEPKPTPERVRTPQESQTAEATGGDRIVCVRACDGYFFPLETRPKGSATEASMCQALCPNTEVHVFRAPRDGSIENAVSEKGKPYMQLANALKYQKSYDPSCSYKKEGETWAQALQKAERMLASNKSDIVVTQEVAERMSRASTGEAKSAKITRKSSTSQAAAKPASGDVETTGSITATNVAPGEASGDGTPRPKPRIIALDAIPVPSAGVHEPARAMPRP